MRRIFCTQLTPDPAHNIELLDVASPRPRDAEVLIHVLARPINPADLLLLTGRHVYTPALPAPVGIEGAGVVIEAGAGAGVAVGTRVALPFGGTWTEQLTLPADVVVPLPDDLPLEQGAMLCVNPMTAAGLLEGLREGDHVLLNAATSALGRMTLALGARRGLRMVAAARRLDEADALRAAGACAVLRDDDDLPRALRAAVGDVPVRRALDAVAGQATARLFECVGEGGELLVYGLLSDNHALLPAAQLVFRDVTVRGYSRLRSYAALPPARRQALGAEVVEAMRGGLLTSAVEARYPLAEAAAALRHHARPDRRGKVLLTSEGP
ncbi:MAG: zinc-dependent alcohol dehydrogenase family protein [Deltaproteobacteria bacterium]|nr:zinc-dependent alcohol dehydrogenase family protein [Deltaproteobacteria bacterium]